ncbi:MAG: hypothetical protein IPH31_22820 [Lewinellaceae bacterium]|nr:hypothetical protein [Lewinellaceae bacterium]
MSIDNQPQVILIDDNYPDDDYLLIALREKYGDENVKLFSTAELGMEYVFAHLSNKMVVLIDMNLGNNRDKGDIVLKKIRERTSLVSVIMMSANLPVLSNEELRRFINHHAVAAINSNDSVSVNLPIIEDTVNQLSLRVDCALEEWILRHSPTDREKPYLVTRSGEQITLNQLLIEIRLNTPFGIRTQQNILNLSVELLARQKEKL